MESKVNVEIKARCDDPDRVRAALLSAGADYRGLDQQTDTYFSISDGRLKLRQGDIENNLIFYRRADQAGPRPSHVRLHRPSDPSGLCALLADALPVDVVVQKSRHIYFLGNVKVHVDDVAGLGHFLEIEAIGSPAPGVEERLERQCRELMVLLGVEDAALVKLSYSDMIRRTGGAARSLC